jgi:DNA invertase Pin-like site-specific DNA recombinase
MLCETRGITIIDVLRENDTSASGKKPRPLYQRLLQMIEDGQVDYVVAYRMDRLTRSLSELEHLISLSERTGVRVATAAGDVDLSTDAGRLVGRILASVARGEIETKSRRHRDANAQAAQEGRRVGGRRPFGYEQDGMTIRPAEAKAIRQGYADYLAGVSLAEIARQWNAAGHWAQTRQWEAYGVRQVLKNPRYAGLRALRGEIVGPAQWPALVEEETWRAVRAVFDGRQRRTARPRSVLTRVGRCGYPYRTWSQFLEAEGADACGATIHSGGATRGYRMYRCSGAYGHIARSAVPVEEYVFEVAIGRLSAPDARDLLVDDDRPDASALRAEAMSLRTRLTEIAGLFADGTLTATQLQEGTTRIRARLEEVEATMADAGRVSAIEPLLRGEDVRAAWEAYPDARKSLAIDALMEVWVFPPGRGTRTFRPETVGIRWKGAGA